MVRSSSPISDLSISGHGGKQLPSGIVKANIVLLPGDGIGPEVITQASKVLTAAVEAGGNEVNFDEQLIGGAAIDATGQALPDVTLQACRAADAVLLGAVGGPAWEGAAVRPEQGLLGLRLELGLFANLRPIRVLPELAGISPLRQEAVVGVDILFVRELTGGLYFGESGASATEAYQVMRYSVDEVRRIVRLAAAQARQRRNKLTSVDKANVLEPSRLWRREAALVMAEEFPDVEYGEVLVDAMAMYLLSRPSEFDVIVTANLFGDILTDEASMLTGSLGMVPSASMGENGPGLYEPVHGSAPDIAGEDVANPVGAILAAAMALSHGLGLEAEAKAIENAVVSVLAKGLRTADIAAGGAAAGTAEMGAAVVAALVA